MKCALCENEYTKLCQSHLIPKLVYKRIRFHPKSRFRNLSEVTHYKLLKVYLQFLINKKC